MADTKKEKFAFVKRHKKWFLGSSALLLIIGVILLYKIYQYVVPLYDRAQTYELSRIDEVEAPSVILDRNGFEIGRIYVENRSMIPIEEMPQLVIECLIAQEDQRFWEQNGVDWVGLLRGVWLNIKAGENTQGASTMTMQLARNVFNLKNEALERDESGITRKIVEICVANRIGKQFSSKAGKKYILESYLNRVPFGHGYYGIRSASLGYFGKEPAELEWQEAASLVSCIKNPYMISPLRNPDTNKKARDHVFRRLNAEGVITDEKYEELREKPVVTNPRPLKRQTSHMYEKVNLAAQKLLGPEKMAVGGFRIHTTIDLNLQNAAEKSLLAQLNKIEAQPGYAHARYADYNYKDGPPEYLQGGMFVTNPQNGEVLVHIGGRDFNHTQYDFVESAKRPAATGVLPFLYAYAIEEGYTAASTLNDSPLDNRLVMIGGREGILGEWGSESLAPEYEGEISLRTALQKSKVSASIRLGRELGIQNYAEFGAKYEFDFPETDDLLTRDLLGWNPISIVEGTRAYTSLVNDGKMINEFTYIDRIEDPKGLLVYIQPGVESSDNFTQVIKPSTAYQVYDILSDGLRSEGNLAQAASKLVQDGFTGGAKTGTPYNFTDAWAFAFDKNIVCTTWLGFQKGNNGAITTNGFAKDLAFPIVAETLSNFDPGSKRLLVDVPNEVEAKEICSVSGLLATRYCFGSNADGAEEKVFSTKVTEHFEKGHGPTGLCSVHMGLKEGVNFGDKFAPTEGESAARPVLKLASIKPRTSSVVGGDPYGAVSNAQAEEKQEDLPEDYASSLLILNDVVPGEKEAKINLPQPKKLQLKINLQAINPGFLPQPEAVTTEESE